MVDDKRCGRDDNSKSVDGGGQRGHQSVDGQSALQNKIMAAVRACDRQRGPIQLPTLNDVLRHVVSS
jgi:hypothetical protein